MKSMWLAMAMAVAVMAASAARAEEKAGCCPAGGAGAQEMACDMGCMKALKGLDLTAEQKDKIKEIRKACKEGGCSEEACKKSIDEIRGVLTAEQTAKFDEALKDIKAGGGCGKKAGGCGAKEADKA